MATLAQKWSVLVVSEEEEALQSIADTLTRRGYRVLTAPGGGGALPLLERDTVHVVLTDLKMRRVGGLDVLREAHAVDPDIAVIMMTRFGSIASAVEAMRCGAYDYLTKPVNLHELEMVVQRAVAQLEVNAEVRELRRRLDIEYGFENIIGNSPAMRRIYRTIIQVAASAGTILLAGESGTGKELIARAIHRNSPRQDKPFIALSCAAFSEGLLENELFGHERGAFMLPQQPAPHPYGRMSDVPPTHSIGLRACSQEAWGRLPPRPRPIAICHSVRPFPPAGEGVESVRWRPRIGRSSPA
jgi:DNA-binding NtrC family response regulator